MIKLTFSLNTSLVEYKSESLNNVCKADVEELLVCSFHEDTPEGSCNTGVLECLDHSKFQDISLFQQVEYSSRMEMAFKSIWNDVWCNIKAQAFAVISYLYDNIILLKQESMLKNIKTQQEKYCHNTVSVDLSVIFIDNSFKVNPSGENAVEESDID